MKGFIAIGFFIVCLLASLRAEAQTNVSLDVGPTSFGIGGGTIFGHGSVMPGFGFDARQGYVLNAFAPSIGAYATIALRLAPTWYLLNNLGGGVAVNNNDMTWNARALFILVGTSQITLRASVFASWTPQTSGVSTSVKAGPFIRLGDTGFRLYPYLALTFTTARASNSVDVVISPGCSLFLYL